MQSPQNPSVSHTLLTCVVSISLALFAVMLPAQGAGKAQDPEAKTADNATIGLTDLDLMLKPLTMAELEVEAKAWRKVLQDKVAGISQLQIQAAKEKDAATKDKLLEAISKQQNDRTALADRVNAVIAAWKAKGGDTKEIETYVSVVTTFTVDTEDVQGAWKTISSWVLSEQGGQRIGKNILYFLITLFAFWIVARIFGSIVARALNRFRSTSELLRNFLANIVRKIILLVGVVVALARLEVDITPLIAALGAAGFVLGFALQGTLSNFAAGVMILLYKPYDTGDVVSVAGVTGKVQAMNIVSTTIKTPDNQVQMIPNGSIWGGTITNITGSPTRRVDMKFGIGYGDDIKKANALLLEILENHERVLKQPAPVVKVHELADSSVNFVVRPWVKTDDYWDVYWDITRQVKERFDAEGVSIPFPQRDLHIVEQAAPASAS